MIEEKIKWYEKKAGETSSGRILIMSGGFVGLIMDLAGVVLVFMNNPNAATVLMTGSAMFGTAVGGKSYLSKQEAIQ